MLRTLKIRTVMILGLVIGVPALAQAQDDKAQIKALAKSIIIRSAQQTDPAVLKRVRGLLEKANARLTVQKRARPQKDRRACIDFAQTIYGQTMIATAAQAEAAKQCQAPVFMPGVRYLFETYAKTSLARPAFERALDHARARVLRGRMRFLKFVVGVFDDTRTQQAALRDGLIFVDAVPRAAEACIQASHSTGLRTMVSLTALERARSTCLVKGQRQ